MKQKIIASAILCICIVSLASTQVSALGQNKEEIQNIKNQALQEAQKEKERLQNEALAITTGATSTAVMQQNAQKLRNEASTTKVQVKEMVQNRKEIILRDFDRGIEVLGNLYARVESRINKMKTLGMDMTESSNLLKISSEKIAMVKTEYEKLSAMIPAEIEKSKASELFKQTREQSVVLRKTMKDVHASLVDIINSLKKSVVVASTNQ